MRKYSQDEILQILTDFYNFQAAFDPEVDNGQTLTFNTTISEWRMICDLIEPIKLAKCHHDFFNIKTPLADFEKLLLNENSKTLGDFCNYVSENSEKAEVKPIYSLGQKCLSASIYKSLIDKLKILGIDTKDIRPSSKFVPLFDKHTNEFMEEVNKLAPGSLTKFEYRDNKIVRFGWSIIGFSLLGLILISLIWQFHWIMLLFLGLGIITIVIGRQYKPEKEIIGGYNTIRDLIKGMETILIKTATQHTI